MDFEALMLKKSKQALPLAEPINNPVRPLDPAAGADVPAMEVDQNHVDLVDVDRGIAPPPLQTNKRPKKTLSLFASAQTGNLRRHLKRHSGEKAK